MVTQTFCEEKSWKRKNQNIVLSGTRRSKLKRVCWFFLLRFSELLSKQAKKLRFFCFLFCLQNKTKTRFVKALSAFCQQFSTYVQRTKLMEQKRKVNKKTNNLDFLVPNKQMFSKSFFVSRVRSFFQLLGQPTVETNNLSTKQIVIWRFFFVQKVTCLSFAITFFPSSKSLAFYPEGRALQGSILYKTITG